MRNDKKEKNSNDQQLIKTVTNEIVGQKTNEKKSCRVIAEIESRLFWMAQRRSKIARITNYRCGGRANAVLYERKSELMRRRRTDSIRFFFFFKQRL